MSTSARRITNRARYLAPLAAAALLLQPTPALADHLDDDENPDNVCTLAPDDVSFSDTGPVFERYIECIAGFGIVQGDGTGRFVPGDDVTRGQASEFVTNMLEVSLGEELPNGGEQYDDVADTGTFAEPIGKLSEAGIITGFDADSFGPTVELTRGQMARIVHEALQYLQVPTDESRNGRFSDVAAGGVFSADVWALSNFDGEPQVIDGDTSGRFGAAREISRGELAKFIAEALYQIDRAGRFAPRGPDTGAATAYTVLPGTALTLGHGEQMEFTVEGLDPAMTYRLSLIDPSELLRGSGGYRITTTPPLGSSESLDSAIVMVDGVAAAEPEPEVGAVVALDGTLRFTVEGAGPEAFMPVVHVDLDGDGLDGDADGLPTEDFGVGGLVTVEGEDGEGEDGEGEDGEGDGEDGDGEDGDVVVGALDLLGVTVSLDDGVSGTIDVGDVLNLQLDGLLDGLLAEDATTLVLLDVGGAEYHVVCDADRSGDGAAACSDEGDGLLEVRLLDDPTLVAGSDGNGMQVGATVEQLLFDGDLLGVRIDGVLELTVGSVADLLDSLGDVLGGLVGGIFGGGGLFGRG